MFNWIKRKPIATPPTSEAEIEAIANRKLMEALLNISIARSEKSAKTLLETSRLVRGRADQQETQWKKTPKWRRRVLEWLGVASVMQQHRDDLRFVAERFKFLGDVTAGMNAAWHVSVMALTAADLESAAKLLDSEQDRNDLLSASTSVRQLATRFMPDKTQDTQNATA